MKRGIMKIINALIEHEEGLTFTSLRKEITISAPVLSEYLDILQTAGTIFHGEDKKYRLKTIYFPKIKLSERGQAFRKLCGLTLLSGVPLKKIQKKDKKIAMLRLYVETFLYHLLPIVVWGIIQGSLESYSARDKESAKIHKLSDALNAEFVNYLQPFIENMAMIIGSNSSELAKMNLMQEKEEVWIGEFVNYLGTFFHNLKEEGVVEPNLAELTKEILKP